MTTTVVLPDFTLQTAAEYKVNIDNTMERLAEVGNQFTVSELPNPGWGVMVNGGVLSNGTHIMPGTVAGIARPPSGSRIDRVYLATLSGAFERVVGAIAPIGTNPVAPPLPAFAFPLAQILVNSADTMIINPSIVDERPTVTLPESAGTLVKPYLRVGFAAEQTLAVNAYDKVRPDTVRYDPMSQWDGPNTRMIPKVAGFWQLVVKLRVSVVADAITDIPVKVAVYKNSTLVEEMVTSRYSRASGTQTTDAMLVCNVTANGSTDFLEIYASVAGVSGQKLLPIGTYIEAQFVGPA